MRAVSPKQNGPLSLGVNDGEVATPLIEVRLVGRCGLDLLTLSFSHFGRVEMWRGCFRFEHICFRLFRLAVP